MIVTKTQLNAIIKEEIEIVLTERDIRIFLETEVMPFIRSQQKLLNEQQQAILEEGIKEIFGGIKDAVSKGWKGVKRLFSIFISGIKSLPFVTAAGSALGWALTQTPEGQSVVESARQAVRAAMEASAQGGMEATKVLNVGIEMLQHLGMDIYQYDPQAVIAETDARLANMDTALDMFMAIPPQYFVFFGISSIGMIALYNLIKAAWNKATGKAKESPAEKALNKTRKRMSAAEKEQAEFEAAMNMKL